MKPAPRLIAWYLKASGYRAITLPPFGIYAIEGSTDDAQLARHEQAHWEQYKRMGLVKFYVTYLWLLMRHGYHNHPMEIEARNKELS
jgi:hypothetical protein